MLPNFLLPEQALSEDGEGPAIEIPAGRTLELTLGITHVIEQESLDVSVYGSADGSNWSPKPLTAFPQKFYPGIWSILLDLSPQPDLRQLKVRFKMNRWGKWSSGPTFRFYVFAAAAQ
ncbi:MAG: hypothetical protein WKF37_03230 [Bryobacteraceae bacterium]